jgi:hypothetical protein
MQELIKALQEISITPESWPRDENTVKAHTILYGIPGTESYSPNDNAERVRYLQNNFNSPELKSYVAKYPSLWEAFPNELSQYRSEALKDRQITEAAPPAPFIRDSKMLPHVDVPSISIPQSLRERDTPRILSSGRLVDELGSTAHPETSSKYAEYLKAYSGERYNEEDEDNVLSADTEALKNVKLQEEIDRMLIRGRGSAMYEPGEGSSYAGQGSAMYEPGEIDHEREAQRGADELDARAEIGRRGARGYPDRDSERSEVDFLFPPAPPQNPIGPEGWTWRKEVGPMDVDPEHDPTEPGWASGPHGSGGDTGGPPGGGDPDMVGGPPGSRRKIPNLPPEYFIDRPQERVDSEPVSEKSAEPAFGRMLGLNRSQREIEKDVAITEALDAADYDKVMRIQEAYKNHQPLPTEDTDDWSYMGKAMHRYKEGGFVGYAQGDLVEGVDPASPPVEPDALPAEDMGFVGSPEEAAVDQVDAAQNGDMGGDNVDAEVPEGSFVLNSYAVELAGIKDIEKLVKDAKKFYMEQKQQEGLVSPDEGQEEDIEIRISEGEYVIPPALVRIIGRDRLEKINKRGIDEFERQQAEETEMGGQEMPQEPQGFMPQEMAAPMPPEGGAPMPPEGGAPMPPEGGAPMPPEQVPQGFARGRTVGRGVPQVGGGVPQVGGGVPQVGGGVQQQQQGLITISEGTLQAALEAVPAPKPKQQKVAAVVQPRGRQNVARPKLPGQQQRLPGQQPKLPGQQPTAGTARPLYVGGPQYAALGGFVPRSADGSKKNYDIGGVTTPVPRDKPPVPQDTSFVSQDKLPVPQDMTPVPQDKPPVPRDKPSVPQDTPIVSQDTPPVPVPFENLSFKEQLIRSVLGEASLEELEGQQAVLNVFHNRKQRNQWKNKKDLELLKQSFSVLNKKDSPEYKSMMSIPKDHKIYKQVEDLVNVYLDPNQKLKDITNGADHYFNPSLHKIINKNRVRKGESELLLPKWVKELTKSAWIGKHVFYNSEWPERHKEGFLEGFPRKQKPTFQRGTDKKQEGGFVSA